MKRQSLIVALAACVLLISSLVLAAPSGHPAASGRRTWVNNAAPALNSTNLNAIESEIADLYKYPADAIDIAEAYGSGATLADSTISTAVADLGTSTEYCCILAHGDWDLDANLDLSTYTNISWVIMPGCDLQLDGCDLTFGGPVIAWPGAAITESGAASTVALDGGFWAEPGVVFHGFEAGDVTAGKTSGIGEIYVTWWGTDAAALQSAINAIDSTYYGAEVKIGLATIDIGGDTVTYKTNTRITGISPYLSKIVMNDGTLSFGAVYGSGSGWNKKLAGVYVYNTGTSSTTVQLGDLDGSNNGPYCAYIEDCNLRGGAKTIEIDGSVMVEISNCFIRQDSHTDRYALYVNSTAYNHQLTISGGCYIKGKTYIGGNKNYGLSVRGNVFESTYGPQVQVALLCGGEWSGNYHEANGDISLFDVDSGVYGLSVRGNTFDSSTATAVPVLCDGEAVTIEANVFAYNHASDHITLESNSDHCRIGVNSDISSGDAELHITNNGTQNEICGRYNHTPGGLWPVAVDAGDGSGTPYTITSAGTRYAFDIDELAETYVVTIPDALSVYGGLIVIHVTNSDASHTLRVDPADDADQIIGTSAAGDYLETQTADSYLFLQAIGSNKWALLNLPAAALPDGWVEQ